MDTDLLERIASWAVYPDPETLRRQVRTLLLDIDPERVAPTLGCLLERPLPSRLRHGYLALVLALVEPDPLPYQRARDLYEVAAREGHAGLCRLLASDAPLPRAGGSRVRRDPLFDELPLGTRKWKARLHDRDLLDRLLLDPDPSVVEILLGNPKITEEQVVRLASHRPNRPEVLLRVLRDARWLPRAAIHQALALNPWTPLGARLLLLPLLPRVELRVLRRSPVGQPEMDEAVARILDAPAVEW